MLLGYGLSCLTDRSDGHKNLLTANLNSLHAAEKNRPNNFLYPARQHLRWSGHICIRLLNRRNTKSCVKYSTDQNDKFSVTVRICSVTDYPVGKVTLRLLSLTRWPNTAQEHQSRFSWAVLPHRTVTSCTKYRLHVIWRLPVYSPGYRTKIFAEMTICWQVPYGSTAVLVVLRYHGSTVTSTVLVLWERSTLVPW